MNKAVYKGLRRNLTKRAPIDTSKGSIGYGTVPDGCEEADINLTIDLDAIAARLGLKAMKNKTGKAKMMNGLIVAQAVNRRRVTS